MNFDVFHENCAHRYLQAMGMPGNPWKIAFLTGIGHVGCVICDACFNYFLSTLKACSAFSTEFEMFAQPSANPSALKGSAPIANMSEEIFLSLKIKVISRKDFSNKRFHESEEIEKPAFSFLMANTFV